jgi:hypothetical protein
MSGNTVVHVPPRFPAPLEEDRFAQNGDLPSVSGFRRVASTYNNVSAYQRKLIMCKAYDTQSTPAGIVGTVSSIFFIFRTGANVQSIGAMVGLAPADTAGATSTYARVRIATVSGAGSAMSTGELHHPVVNTAGTYAPSEVSWRWGEIIHEDLAPDTEYFGWLELTGYCRAHSIMVYEKAAPVIVSQDDGVTKMLVWEGGHPIYDDNVEDLVEAGTELWRHNSAQLINWTRKGGATNRDITSASWTNVISGSTAGVSATSAGLVIQTLYHDTQVGDVPVQLGVYAQRTAGAAALDVKLDQDGVGTLLQEDGITTSASVVVSSHTIPASAGTKTDILCRTTAGTTWRIYAIALWEYEA